mgnify:CR=1 FL=1|jgi:hypothetical protein
MSIQGKFKEKKGKILGALQRLKLLAIVHNDLNSYIITDGNVYFIGLLIFGYGDQFF